MSLTGRGFMHGLPARGPLTLTVTGRPDPEDPTDQRPDTPRIGGIHAKSPLPSHELGTKAVRQP